MENNEEKLSPELKEKLLEVELAADAEEQKNNFARFDISKGTLTAALCAGLSLTLGVALQAGLFNSVMFSLLMAAVGFICAGYQRPNKK